jgi:outer membrane protein OmpA-like peptidoglycan-associated protein
LNSFVRGLRAGIERAPWRALAGIGLLALGACAPAPTKPVPVAPKPVPAAPAQPPAPVAKPAPPTAKPKVQPTPSAGTGVVVLAPGNYDRDRDALKLKLAKANPDALVPDDVGYTLDVLQGRLRQVGGNTLRVMRQPHRLVLDLSGNIGFVPGTAQLDDVGTKVLAPIAQVLADYRMTLVSVLVRDGAVASKPDQSAQAVVRALIDAGVPVKRLVILGWGSATADQKNMANPSSTRVELQIEPIMKLAEPADKPGAVNAKPTPPAVKSK